MQYYYYYLSTLRPQHTFSSCKEKAIVRAKRSCDDLNTACCTLHSCWGFILTRLIRFKRCWCVPFSSFHLRLAFLFLAIFMCQNNAPDRNTMTGTREKKKSDLDVVFGFLNKSIKRLFCDNVCCGRVYTYCLPSPRQCTFRTDWIWFANRRWHFFFPCSSCLDIIFVVVGRCITGSLGEYYRRMQWNAYTSVNPMRD